MSMDVSTVNQIIETSGIIIASIVTASVVYYFLNKLLTKKYKNDREIELLKTILFLRQVIEKYKEKTKEDDDSSQYNNIRKMVKNELSFEPTSISEPAGIKKRLAELDELSEKLDNVIDGIK